MRGIRRALSLSSLGIKQMFSYREDFLIGAVATGVFHLSSLSAVYLLFSIAGGINDWSPTDGVFLATVSSLRFALGKIGFWGLSALPRLIASGDLDRVLLYPCTPIPVLLLRDLDPLSVLDTAILLGTLVWSFPRCGLSTLSVIAFVVLMVLGLVATYGFMLLTVSLSFWAKVRNMFPQVFRVLWEFQPYPMTIYPTSLRVVLTWVVPIAVAVVIPVESLTSRTPILPASLIVGTAAVGHYVLGTVVFRVGLRRYESTGQ